MSIRGVLFDVGGPIDTEAVYEQLVDRDLKLVLARHGFEVSDARFERAAREAVRCYAPDAYRAIVWDLLRPDRSAALRVYDEFASLDGHRQSERGGIEPRPGIGALLKWLAGRGLRLGLAANQPARALSDLQALGLARYFGHREVTGTHGLRKPDLRLFLRACEDLDVGPEECAMLGDRIDVDIAPAARLGMRTILLRTGRHRDQQPRTWGEVPDYEVHDVEGISTVLKALLEQ